MTRLVVYMFTSLDGFITGPDGNFDDYEPSDEEHRVANAFFGEANGVLFGRVTYQGFQAYWDTLDVDDPSVPSVAREFATLFRKLPRMVASRTLHEVDAMATLIKGNVTAQVAALKRSRDGYWAVVCGPELLGTLANAGLVDEFRILVKSRVMGRGKMLFASVRGPLRLRLLESRAFDTGTVLQRYDLEK